MSDTTIEAFNTRLKRYLKHAHAGAIQIDIELEYWELPNNIEQFLADALIFASSVPDDLGEKAELLQRIEWARYALMKNLPRKLKKSAYVVSLLLARLAPYSTLEVIAKGRSTGGKSTGQRKKKTAEQNRQICFKEYKRRFEHSDDAKKKCAGILAREMGLTATTVRRYLRESGIKLSEVRKANSRSA